MNNNKYIRFVSVKNVNNNLIKKIQINNNIFDSIVDNSNSNRSINNNDK